MGKWCLHASSFIFVRIIIKIAGNQDRIKAWSSSNLVQIRQLILELLALEWRKFHTFELEYLWSEVGNLDQILCVASLGWGKGCIRFWGWLTLARWTQVSDRCPLGYLSFVPVFQCCCSTPQGSPGVGHNMLFLSSPHLCFIIVFICDLFVSRDDPLMGWKTFTRTEQLYVLSHDRSRGRGWDPVKPV